MSLLLRFLKIKLIVFALTRLHRKNKNFVGLSFDTISSTGPNAAVIHYKPEPGNCSVIDPKAVYLCDSGAQYLDGTTDTTRTLHFGEPSAMERKAYTLVLKGVIALDKVVFPKGTTGFALDTLARQFLWEEGLDYRHGTGHGVGSYLVRNSFRIALFLNIEPNLDERTSTKALSASEPISNIRKSLSPPATSSRTVPLAPSPQRHFSAPFSSKSLN